MLACCRSLAGRAPEAEEAATVAVAAAVRVAVVAGIMSAWVQHRQREQLWCSQESTKVTRLLFSIGRTF